MYTIKKTNIIFLIILTIIVGGVIYMITDNEMNEDYFFSENERLQQLEDKKGESIIFKEIGIEKTKEEIVIKYEILATEDIYVYDKNATNGDLTDLSFDGTEIYMRNNVLTIVQDAIPLSFCFKYVFTYVPHVWRMRLVEKGEKFTRSFSIPSYGKTFCKQNDYNINQDDYKHIVLNIGYLTRSNYELYKERYSYLDRFKEYSFDNNVYVQSTEWTDNLTGFTNIKIDSSQ